MDIFNNLKPFRLTIEGVAGQKMSRALCCSSSFTRDLHHLPCQTYRTVHASRIPSPGASRNLQNPSLDTIKRHTEFGAGIVDTKAPYDCGPHQQSN